MDWILRQSKLHYMIFNVSRNRLTSVTMMSGDFCSGFHSHEFNSSGKYWIPEKLRNMRHIYPNLSCTLLTWKWIRFIRMDNPSAKATLAQTSWSNKIFSVWWNFKPPVLLIQTQSCQNSRLCPSHLSTVQFQPPSPFYA